MKTRPKKPLRGKLIAPNTVLPAGALLLEKIVRAKIGDWVEMEFDAKAERFGMIWYRARGGLSGDGDSEAWLLSIPAACVSVSDYMWRAPRWGIEKYNSFDAAIKGQLAKALWKAEDKVAKLHDETVIAYETVRLLKIANGKAKGRNPAIQNTSRLLSR